MKLTALLECISLVAAVHAATFRAPIASVGRDADSIARERMAAMIEAETLRARKQNREGGRAEQRHRKGRRMRSGPVGDVENDEEYMDFIKESSMMRAEESEPQVSRRPLPLSHWNELTYTTTISLGTPPQLLNVLLSISDSNLFIPSSKCTSDSAAHRYSPTNSSTHISHTAIFRACPLRFYCRGILLQDTLHFSSIQIRNQMFGEVEEMFSYTPLCDSSWDGLLGLAPSSGNPFQNMAAQKLLDRNLFSLRLPRAVGGEGEILFGAIDHDLYLGELKALPLLPRDGSNAEEVKGRWAVAATKLTIGDASVDFDGGVAVFETDFPFIGLPENYVTLLDRYLGMDNAGSSWEHLRSIDCSERRRLENITITLAGEAFVISPWEYTIEVETADSGKRCASAFMPNEDYGDENIVLGSAFLRAFYGVFDLDERTISLARATSQKIEMGKVGWEEELKKRSW